MNLARDTRRTLGLAIEALIDLLDAVGPDPEAEPSLGATSAISQEYAWDLDPGHLDDREDEHDGCEPGEDEPHHYNEENRVSIHAAHKQARAALKALVERLRPQDGSRKTTADIRGASIAGRQKSKSPRIRSTVILWPR